MTDEAKAREAYWEVLREAHANGETPFDVWATSHDHAVLYAYLSLIEWARGGVIKLHEAHKRIAELEANNE